MRPIPTEGRVWVRPSDRMSFRLDPTRVLVSYAAWHPTKPRWQSWIDVPALLRYAKLESGDGSHGYTEIVRGLRL